MGPDYQYLIEESLIRIECEENHYFLEKSLKTTSLKNHHSSKNHLVLEFT